MDHYSVNFIVHISLFTFRACFFIIIITIFYDFLPFALSIHHWLFFKPGFRASKYTFSIIHKTNLESFGRKTPEIYHFEIGSLKKRVPRYLMTATIKSAPILSEGSLNHSRVLDEAGFLKNWFKKKIKIFLCFSHKKSPVFDFCIFF